MSAPALLTDLYELTMMEGYHRTGRIGDTAVFDVFFRSNPFGGGYAVFAGLEQAASYLTRLSFSSDDIACLNGLGIFSRDFLDYLAAFRFSGDLYAFAEGSIVFPEEPIARVEAPLGEAQFVEAALLNILNFQTLIATKASRVVLAAGGRPVVEFGLRRAQGEDGALSASRAAYIGGCDGTSNVLAGKRFGIPVRGTHAHSWVMAFDDELSAFRAYAETYPDSSILLVDTYDSVESGIPNAIRVARELEERGHRLSGIRLDSGDPFRLCRLARTMLDEAGLGYVKIVLSNDLDEYSIKSLTDSGVPVDIFGVGTRLVTGHGEGALSGVYKMASLAGNGTQTPRLKLSDELPKGSLPGIKNVLRCFDDTGLMLYDVIRLAGVAAGEPVDMRGNRVSPHGFHHAAEQLRPIVVDGARVGDVSSLEELRERCRSGLAALSECFRRFDSPPEYPVLLDQGLFDLRLRMIAEIQSGLRKD